MVLVWLEGGPKGRLLALFLLYVPNDPLNEKNKRLQNNVVKKTNQT